MKTKTLPILWRTFYAYRWHVALLIVLGVFGAVFEGIGINIAIPLASFFLNSGQPTDLISRSVEAIFGFLHIPFVFRYLLAFIVVLFFMRAVAVATFGYIRGWITADFLSSKSEAVLDATLHASWPFLLRQRLGDLHSSLIRDIQRSSHLLEVFGQTIQSFSGFFMYLLIAFNISPLVTLCTIAGGGLLLFIVRPLLLRSRRTGQGVTEAERQFSQFVSEHIIGVKSLKAGGMEDRAVSEGNQVIARLRELWIRLGLIRAMSTSLFQPFGLIFVIVLFFITYKSPGFNIVSFAATLYLIQRIFSYLEVGQNSLQSVSELVPYAERLNRFQAELVGHHERRVRGDQPFAFERELACRDLRFAYGEAAVLKGVSLTIRRGEMVGLVGASGAGKSTVADLLLRLFDPQDGEILLDGVSASRIDLTDWRRHVGYVPQDPFLLNDTIEANIRFYRPELSHEEVRQAAMQANILTFIESLPQGFDTLVGDRGVMLSGGQRQRVVLARALAGSPKLLILDEATSALDTESETLIQEAIHSLHGTIAVLAIAHRLSTLLNADRIVVLKEGAVAEEGSYESLWANPGSYLHRMQKEEQP